MANRSSSRGVLGTGRVLSGLVSLFLLIDGGARLAGARPYIEGLSKAGYDPGLAPWIGIALVGSTLLYLFPRTAILGAILVTGYLGGATATQVRLGDPWFLFPIFLGVLTWGGLWFRYPGLRALLPLTSPAVLG
jgi:hypothetical protein